MFALTGAVGGFLSGLLGIGGALIFIPILTHHIQHANVGEESVPYLLANSFMVVFFAGIAASYRQYKSKNSFFRESIQIAIPATIISLLVVFTIEFFLKSQSANIKPIFKGMFLIILVFIVVLSFISKKSKNYQNRADSISRNQKILAGGLVGFFSGITGLGGGSIMLPLFHNFYKIKYSIATSMSSSIICLFVFPSLILYGFLSPQNYVNQPMQTGYICWHLILPMVPFIILFSQFGVKMNHRFPVWLTKTIFAIIILINIIKIIVL